MKTNQARSVSSILLFLFVLSVSLLSPVQSVFPEPVEGEVRIEIRDSTFIFKGGTFRPNEQNIILLSNEDPARHGFTSEAFPQMKVEVEGEFGEVYGKGIQGIYINPGETLELRVTPAQAGKISFRCDLHPKMEGEFLVLSI
ncbi:MAG TPA: hypothetical protein VIU33_02310 [Nitrospiria bacterium]